MLLQAGLACFVNNGQCEGNGSGGPLGDPGTNSPPGGSQPASAPALSTNVADLDISQLVNVRVSPFEVSTRQDKGYRAWNSVSASRFNAPIKDLPFAIQAYTESFIEDQKPVSLFDIVRYSPGVTFRGNDFNEGNANLDIRGFAVSASPGSVQVLRDGFHGPSIFDFTDVSRVEIVKGPASFLYGQVAPGGIVNVITKSPQREFSATAKAGYGSYNEYRFDGDITGPVTTNLFFRLASSYFHDIEYWKPYDASSWDAAPSLLWQPYETLSFSLKYEHYGKSENPQVMQKPGYNAQRGPVPTASDPNLSGVDVPGLPDDWNSMSDVDFRSSRVDAVTSWVDLKVGEHWNLRTAYSHLEYEVDELASGNFGMPNNSTRLQGRRLRFQNYANHDDTFEEQGVGEYNFDIVSVRTLLGAQYTHRSFHAQAGQAPNDPALGSNPTASPLPLWDLNNPATWNRHVTIPLSTLTASASSDNIPFEDKSVYGGVTLGFFDDRLLVLGGERYTAAKSQTTHSPGATVSKYPAIHNEALTPQAGLLYKLTPCLSAFGSYSESFVPATLVLTKPDRTTTPSSPTEGNGYDIGLKADLFHRRLTGTLTFFDVENRNIIRDVTYLDPGSGAQLFYQVQTGRERSRGVELDATITPVDNWQIYMSYSYMDARIVDFSGNDGAILARDPATLDAAGRANYRNVYRYHNAHLQMSAPHLANLWTRYDFRGGPLNGVYLGGGVNFVYDQTLLPDTPVRQTYTLVNALVGYGWKWHDINMNVDLMGKNLAQERYRPSQSSRARPIEFLATFTANF